MSEALPEALHLRVIMPPLTLDFTPQDALTQRALRDDARNLILEHLTRLGAPIPKPESWAAASVEIVSEATLGRLRDLENLLRECLESVPDGLAGRIESILDG